MPGLPDGYYAIPDPDDAGTMTYWRARGDRLTAWPRDAWYGPAALLKADAPADIQATREWHQEWLDRRGEWFDRLRKALHTDPATAQRRFAEFWVRCFICARPLTDDTSKTLGIGPDCRRGLDPAALAAINTPVIARAHAQHLTGD